MSRAAKRAIAILASTKTADAEPRYVPDVGKFLVDSGLLFEINRRVLHPLGMALECAVDEKPGHSKIGNVWDYRDDPEGIRFGDDEFKSGLAKLRRFMAEFGDRKLAQRRAILGFVVQGESQDREEEIKG